MGIAAAIWLDEDVPQQPEQLQVTAPPVAEPDIVQMDSQTLQTEPVISSAAIPLLVQNKPQIPAVLPTPAPVTAKPIVAQPVAPQVKIEPAKIVPPIVPPVQPLTASSEQPKNPVVIQQPAKLPAAIQPAVQPVAPQPATPIIKKEPAAATPVAEPLPASNTNIPVPAVNDQQYELIKMN